MRNILAMLVFALILPIGNWLLYAGDQDFGHWGEYGVKGKINDVWFFKSDIQLRFRDDASDYHYFRWEFGPGLKINRRLSILTMYRFNPKQKKGDWNNYHYLMIDPTINLYSSARWAFDLRSRFQVKLGDLGSGFWRPRPQLARKFKIRERESSWFINSELYVQMTELGAGDRINENDFATGFKFGLSSIFNLSAYYMLISEKAALTGKWAHTHLLATELYATF